MKKLMLLLAAVTFTVATYAQSAQSTTAAPVKSESKKECGTKDANKNKSCCKSSAAKSCSSDKTSTSDKVQSTDKANTQSVANTPATATPKK